MEYTLKFGPSILLVLVLLASILTWIRTAHSPLVQIIWALLHMEAIRAQLWATASGAASHFRRNYAATHEWSRSMAFGEIRKEETTMRD